jgi:adenylylsulfate kinase
MTVNDREHCLFRRHQITRSGMDDQNASKSPNTIWHRATVTRARRERLIGHPSAVVWMTGLSGSGKSTLCHAVEERLHREGYLTYVFDGDNVRHGLCGDLGFSPEDRHENIRRIGEMVKLFIDAGVLALTAFITPYREQRQRVRQLVGESNFIEIWCRCPVVVCEERDVKGHYRRARAGMIKEFTGVTAPYEEPEHADLVLDTAAQSIDECVDSILARIKMHGR